MINRALTDSLSLKIPIDLCKVIDKRLTSCTCIYYEDLDAVDCELLPPKPIKISKNGITVRIGLANIPIYHPDIDSKVPTTFINLTVSSKLLKSNYFSGITKDTIKTLYDEFIDFKIFYCDFDTFLDGMISDIDVCINRYADSVDIFTNICEVLFNQAGNKQKFCRKIFEPNSVGLTFNKREFAKPSLPFIKLYHKELELLTNSTEFYNTYLFPEYGEFIKGLTRIEATVKNYDHKKRLEKYNILPKFRTLRDWLEIEQRDLWNFVVFSINSYIEKSPRVPAPDLSPTDHLLYEFIQNQIVAGYDYKMLLNSVLSFKGSSAESTKVAHSRMRKKIKDLFDLLIHKDLKIGAIVLHNKNVSDYLDFIGYRKKEKADV